MYIFVSLASILLAVLIGAMSPGPSFLTVARISMSESRKNGIAAAAGMGSGSVIFSILAILGLKAVFAAFPLIYSILQLIGGIYLGYIGIHIWLGAKKPIVNQATHDEQQNTLSQVYKSAFLIQISNPKTIVFYSSIFASLLPNGIPLWAAMVLPLLVFLVEFSWYCFVALILSSSKPRALYLRLKVWIDRIAGGLMLILGIKLIINAIKAA